MGKGWLLALALAAPALAKAGPALDAAQAHQRVDATGRAADYRVVEPAASQYLPKGWSLYATLRGRSIDIGSRDWGDWSEEPRVQRRDIEAGYGWRSGSATALIGYDQHDYGADPASSPDRRVPDPAPAARFSGAGVLGFSFILHGR